MMNQARVRKLESMLYQLESAGPDNDPESDYDQRKERTHEVLMDLIETLIRNIRDEL